MSRINSVGGSKFFHSFIDALALLISSDQKMAIGRYGPVAAVRGNDFWKIAVRSKEIAISVE
jgi:hypothetical protein